MFSGEETKIVIISTTKIYILDQFTYKLQQTINLKSEENVLKIISWSQDNENTAILKVKAVTHSKDLEFLIDLKESINIDN